MTHADWALLIPAVVGVLGGAAAWLKARAAATSAAAAHARINAITRPEPPK